MIDRQVKQEKKIKICESKIIINRNNFRFINVFLGKAAIYSTIVKDLHDLKSPRKNSFCNKVC